MEAAFDGCDFDSVPCNINDLSVILHKENSVDILPLEDSPAYKYLLDGNDKDYRDYHELVKNKCGLETEHTLVQFNALLALVKENGLDSIDPIIVDLALVIRDGQHRASIYKYLGHTNLLVLQIKGSSNG